MGVNHIYDEIDHSYIQTCPGCGGVGPHWDTCYQRDEKPMRSMPTPTPPGGSPHHVGTRNPKFHAFLAEMAQIHDKKSHDYAKDSNFYSNFEEAAATAGISVDAVFMTLIGVKLARLRELMASGKIPNEESLYDTRLDLAVYTALWASYHRK
jgi:hypothetical protein